MTADDHARAIRAAVAMLNAAMEVAQQDGFAVHLDDVHTWDGERVYRVGTVSVVPLREPGCGWPRLPPGHSGT